MKKCVLNIISATILFLPLIGYTQESWDWQTSNNWDYKIYNNYMIRNNIWGETTWTGAGVGEQTIYTNSESDWKIIATHTDGTGDAQGQVKAYPQVVRGWVQGGIGNTYPDGTPSPMVTDDHGLNQKIDDLTKFDIYHKHILPNSGRYMVLYDMYMFYTDKPKLPWNANLPDQLVMLFTAIQDDSGWMYNNIEQHPIVSIGDRQWRLSVSQSNIVNEYRYTLYPYPEWIIEETHIDYLEILHWLQDNHNLPGNLRISTVQYGVEIIDGGEYRINDFWVDISDVPEDYVEVTGVTVSPKSKTISMGQTLQLTATIEPYDAYFQQVNWLSDDENIAIVDDNGLVTGVGQGAASITVTTEDGSFQDSSDITVEYAEVPVTGVNLEETTLTLVKYSQETLKAFVEPFYATIQSLSWNSDDEDVATVDEVGVVTAVDIGTANITVTTNDGNFTDICVINVVDLPDLSQYANLVLEDNPVAYWRFEEHSGNIVADIKGTNHASLINNPEIDVDGVDGSGIRFINEKSSYAEAPDHPDLNIEGSITIEFWVNLEDGWGGAEREALVGKGDHTYQVRHFNNNRLRFTVRGGTGGNVDLDSENQLSLNEWNHVVAVYDADDEEMRIYFNGQKDSVTRHRKGTIGTTPAGLTFGANYSGYDYRRFFDGKLDEVAIYDYALSPKRIEAHYKALAGETSMPNFENSIDDENINIYPNPANSYVTVNIKEGIKNAWINIISIDGRIVKQKSMSDNIENIQLHDLNPGIYVIKVAYKDASMVKKLIIK